MSILFDYRYGVIVRGAPSAERKIVNYDSAFSAYLGGELESDGEAYLSAFCYPKPFLDYVRGHGFAGYAGTVYARYIPLDFDSADDPLAAIESAQRLLLWLEGTAAADLSAVIVCYSGAKGAHIRLPIGEMLAEPSPDFPKIARAFAALLARDAGVRYLDNAIYDSARLLRLPNTRHPKTGRLCVPFNGGEFSRMKPEAVVSAGAGDRRDGVPAIEPGATWADWTLRDYWARAADYVRRKAAAVPASADDRAALNRDTLEFIRDGAGNGARHLRLFQAAANLGEFGASERLARALLSEAARDSGLPVREIENTIAAGVRHGTSGVAS
jgi:hypothetical protein